MYAISRFPITHGKIIRCLNGLINRRFVFQGHKCNVLVTGHEYLINEKRFENWSKRREQSASSLVFYNFNDENDIEGILDGSIDVSKNITKGCGIHKLNYKLNAKQWEKNTIVCEVLHDGSNSFIHNPHDQMFNVDSQLIYPKYFIKTEIDKANDNYSFLDRGLMLFEENNKLFYEIKEDEEDVFLKNII